MPSGRLALLAIGVCAVVLLLVVGSAIEALRNSMERTRPRTPRPTVKPEAIERQPAPVRYTPARSRLRWYSPEIAAVLLLSLAAGLWLARLVG